MLFSPVITVLFFEVITALGRYQEIRLLIITSLVFVLIPTEQLQPSMIKLHSGIFLPATIFPSLSGNNCVAHRLIFFRWILQQFYLCCHLFGDHREPEFLDYFWLAPICSICTFQRWHIYDPDCPMYPLNAFIFQIGCRYSRNVKHSRHSAGLP